MVLVVSWAHYPSFGPPYAVSTFAFVIACLAAYIFPVCFLGRTLPDSGNRELGKRPMAPAIVSIGGLLFFFLAYYLSRRSLIGLETYEAREQKGSADFGFWTTFYNLSLPLPMLSSFWFARYNYPKTLVSGYAMLIFGFFGITYLFSGGRFELVPLLLAFLSSLFVFNRERIARSLTRGLASVIPVSIGVVGLNLWLNVRGMRGGLGGGEAVVHVTNGAALLSGFGFNDAPDFVMVMVGLLNEYLMKPILHFDYYLTTNYHPPANGGLQFMLLTSRFGATRGLELKEAADSLYAPMGIEGNVWATGVREMIIDFGNLGAVVAFLVVGIVAGLSKRLFRNSDAAKFTYCVCLTFMAFSPFTSLLKAGLMQMAVYVAILWILVEAVSGLGSKPIPFRGAPNDGRVSPG